MINLFNKIKYAILFKIAKSKILNKLAIYTVLALEPIFNKIGAGSLSRDVIAVIIALFVFAILSPIALNQIYATDTSGWNPAVATLFNIFVPVMAILAIAIGFVVLFLRKK
jgi:hypothetical protein